MFRPPRVALSGCKWCAGSSIQPSICVSEATPSISARDRASKISSRFRRPPLQTASAAVEAAPWRHARLPGMSMVGPGARREHAAPERRPRGARAAPKLRVLLWPRAGGTGHSPKTDGWRHPGRPRPNTESPLVIESIHEPVIRPAHPRRSDGAYRRAAGLRRTPVGAGGRRTLGVDSAVGLCADDSNVG